MTPTRQANFENGRGFRQAIYLRAVFGFFLVAFHDGNLTETSCFGLSCASIQTKSPPFQTQQQTKKKRQDFRTFLRSWNRQELARQWSLRNWQQTKDYQQQVKNAWELAARVERDLRSTDWKTFQRSNSDLLEGSHRNTDAFSFIEAVRLKHQFLNWQKTWLEFQFAGKGSIENLPTADQWKQYLTKVRQIEPKLRTIRQFSRQSQDRWLGSRVSNLQAELEAVKAWSLYLRWMGQKESERQKETLVSARNLFFRAIGLSETDFDGQQFSVEIKGIPPKNQPHLIGLGLVFYAQKSWQKGNSCFQALADNSSPQNQIQVRSLQILSLAKSGRWDIAPLFLSDALKRLARREKPGQGDQGVGSFCLLLADGLRPALQRGDASGKNAITFLDSIYKKLVERSQFSVIQRMVEKTEVAPARDSLHGRVHQIFGQLDQNGGRDLPRARRREISKNLSGFVNSDHPLATDRLKAWCYLQLGRLEEPENYRKAIDYLKNALELTSKTRILKKEVQWQIVSRQFAYWQTDPSEQLTTALSENLATFLKEHPEDQLSGIARVYQSQVRYQGDWEKLRTGLETWPSSETGYLFAKQTLLSQLHRRWLSYWSDSQYKEKLGRDIVKVCVQLDRLTSLPVTNPRKEKQNRRLRIRVRTVGLDVLARDSKLARESGEWIEELVRSAKGVQQGSEYRLFHSKLIQVLANLKREVQVIRIAQGMKFTEEKADEDIDLLISITEAYESYLVDEWKKVGLTDQAVADRFEKTRRAIWFYQLLSKGLSRRSNSQESPTQFVYLAIRTSFWLNKLGKHSDAAQLLSDAEKKLPGKTAIQFPLAEQLTASGQFQKAIQVWKQVIPQLPPGRDQWFQAKHSLIESLASSDKKVAIDELRKIRMLFPELPEQWANKFKRLEDRLKRTQ